jgi:RNA polymerase sigma-70 factor (ECF subfamily)
MPEPLVDRARAGDVDAFATLVGGRQEAMTRLAYAIVGNRPDADDALQEALVAIWRGLPGLRDGDRFDAWADRILVNSCRLVLRRRGRRTIREVQPIDGLDGAVAARTHDEDGVADRDAFRRAFDSLDVPARVLIVLHHLEDRTAAEIATVLEIPAGTVKSRLFTARRALEQALDRERS